MKLHAELSREEASLEADSRDTSLTEDIFWIPGIVEWMKFHQNGWNTKELGDECKLGNLRKWIQSKEWQEGGTLKYIYIYILRMKLAGARMDENVVWGWNLQAAMNTVGWMVNQGNEVYERGWTKSAYGWSKHSARTNGAQGMNEALLNTEDVVEHTKLDENPAHEWSLLKWVGNFAGIREEFWSRRWVEFDSMELVDCIYRGLNATGDVIRTNAQSHLNHNQT